LDSTPNGERPPVDAEGPRRRAVLASLSSPAGRHGWHVGVTGVVGVVGKGIGALM